MNVLAIGAYASEIAQLCGGTLAKCSVAGHSVAIAALCCTGTRFPEHTEENAAADVQEFRDSAAVIGARCHNLNLPQFDLSDDYDTRMRVVEVMRQEQAKLIITHDRDDYGRDHRTTSGIVTESVYMAMQPGIKTSVPTLAEHPDVVFMDTIAGIAFEPEQYVDITDVFELKRRMLMAFAREVKEWAGHPVLNHMEWLEATARFRGIQSGYRYAEAFRWPHRWGFAPSEPMLI